MIVDFASGARAMLELCIFAEGARFQKEISAVGPMGKIECQVPGPGRFWPAHLGAPPVARLIVSPRNPKALWRWIFPSIPHCWQPATTTARPLYQHQRFLDVVRGKGVPEVTLGDGAWAVAIGLTAQQSASTGQVVAISNPLCGHARKKPFPPRNSVIFQRTFAKLAENQGERHAFGNQDFSFHRSGAAARRRY